MNEQSTLAQMMPPMMKLMRRMSILPGSLPRFITNRLSQKAEITLPAIKANTAYFKLMEEEIFGPVMTIHVYKDKDYEEALETCNNTSPYGLTGAIFGTDRYAIEKAYKVLRHSAGNFYINDKPTGAVVGLQPFGGSRASGTNDKAGSIANLMRWTSVRTVKETFTPPTDYRYPYMA